MGYINVKNVFDEYFIIRTTQAHDLKMTKKDAIKMAEDILREAGVKQIIY